MVFFDISKAFDRVWHPGLLHKLEQNGNSEDLLLWVSDYHSDRTQSVVLNSVSSTKKVCHSRCTTRICTRTSIISHLCERYLRKFIEFNEIICKLQLIICLCFQFTRY